MVPETTQTPRWLPNISRWRGTYGAAYDWHVRAGSWAQFRDVKAARASWQRARDVADRLPAEEPNKIAMQIGPRTALCASTFRISGSIEDAGYDELRQLCDSAGDKLSLAMGMAGTMTVLVFHNRFREAAELASECGHLAESFEDQIMTLTLSLAAGNAKFQAGEVVEGLRLAQRGIELADGDHTNDNFMIGSPLGFAFGLRGVCRFALGVNGWRDDLDRSVQMTRAGDTTSRTATILFKDGFIVHNGGLLPDVLALAETADALDVAERVGDDFSLDMARLTRGLVLVHGDECDHAAGLELLDRYRQASARHEYTKESVRWADAETAKHFAALGNFDDAIELARLAVDFLHDSGEHDVARARRDGVGGVASWRGKRIGRGAGRGCNRAAGRGAHRSWLRAARTATTATTRASGEVARRRAGIPGLSGSVPRHGE